MTGCTAEQRCDYLPLDNSFLRVTQSNDHFFSSHYESSSEILLFFHSQVQHVRLKIHSKDSSRTIHNLSAILLFPITVLYYCFDSAYIVFDPARSYTVVSNSICFLCGLTVSRKERTQLCVHCDWLRNSVLSVSEQRLYEYHDDVLEHALHAAFCRWLTLRDRG